MESGLNLMFGELSMMGYAKIALLTIAIDSSEL